MYKIRPRSKIFELNVKTKNNDTVETTITMHLSHFSNISKY